MNESSHITTGGGLLAQAFIDFIREPSTDHQNTAPAALGVSCESAPATDKKLEDGVAGAWELLKERWDSIHQEVENLDGFDAPTIDDLFNLRPHVNETRRAAVDERRRPITENRQSMQNELAESGDQQATAWTDGIADIAEGSFDVLGLTTYDPAYAGCQFVNIEIPVDRGNGR